MKPPTPTQHAPGGQASQRGFTLVELMVALTGGLFLSVFVFMLASQGSKFYQSEARISNATIGVMNGFQRLRADIARAGFLASANIVTDPLVCSGKTDAEGWTEAHKMLREMAGIRIIVGGSRNADDVSDALESFWANNQVNGQTLNPDQLIIAGSFTSSDEFPAAKVAQPNPGGQPNVWRVHLQPNSPAMARLGYRTDGSQTPATHLELIQSVFTPDDGVRLLRILDKKGSHHFGIIDTVGLETDSGTGQEAPYIDLTDGVILKQESRRSKCGLQGFNVGATVNVVNFIRYGIKSLNDAEAYPQFAAVYSDEVAGTYEETRAELVREELDVAGNPIDGTTELVAEYAVDLKFGLSVLSNNTLLQINEGAAAIGQYAGDPRSAGVNSGPGLIRSVHARLAVRSREGDREGNIDADATGIPSGLYRVSLGADGAAPFARVRTLQADIALRNHMGAR